MVTVAIECHPRSAMGGHHAQMPTFGQMISCKGIFMYVLHSEENNFQISKLLLKMTGSNVSLPPFCTHIPSVSKYPPVLTLRDI